MMDETQAAEGVAEWAGTLLQIPEERRYSWPVDLKGVMPDVVAVVLRSRLVTSDPRFPFRQLQQAWFFVCDVEVSVMVEKADTDDDAEAVQRALEGYAKALRDSVLADATLGNRVQMASPLVETDLSVPPAVDEGSIKGRAVYMNMAVAELRDSPA